MGSDDDAPAPDASHLTPEEKRGPSTLHVALFLLATLLIVSVLTDPASVLPRDSTLDGASHVDDVSGLEIPVPVGWRVRDGAEFGSIEIVPVDSGSDPDTKILAGVLQSGTAAAAISDDQGAATALAETLQLYVMGIEGERDDLHTADVSNDVGEGKSSTFVVVPTSPGDEDSGGLVYTAVFGTDNQRWWLAYLTSSQGSAPNPSWVAQIVGDVALAE